MPVGRRGVLTGVLGAAAGVLAAPAASASAAKGRPRVRTGIELLISSRYAALRGQTVGVLTNPTGILPDLRHEVDVMHADPGVSLAAVFGPEHGFRGTAQAGGSQGFHDDPRTGLPVYDTYGKSGSALAGVSPRPVWTRSSVVYPGTCLFEGTQASEGRGYLRCPDRAGHR